jgi:hypothetical protein
VAGNRIGSDIYRIEFERQWAVTLVSNEIFSTVKYHPIIDKTGRKLGRGL